MAQLRERHVPRAGSRMSQGDIDRDFDAELAFHLESRMAELLARGLSVDDARSVIRAETGNLDEARRYIAALDRATAITARRKQHMHNLIQEMRHAALRLRRSPGFTLLAVTTLAAGIGACALMFNITSAVLWAPLPFRDAGRLTMVWGHIPQLDLGFPEIPLSGRQFSMLRDNGKAFSSVAAFRARPLNVAAGSSTDRLDGIEATGDFFATLGVQPEVGRFFTRADEEPASRVVVLSDAVWHRRFGADPTIVGRVISIDAEPFVVIGVAQPGFAFPHGTEMPGSFQFPAHADAWIPLTPPKRGPSDLALVARLQPHVALVAARADLDRIRAMMEALVPQGKGFFGMMVVPLRTQLAGRTERLLLSLFGAVSLLLLIACANAAQLQIARLQRRRRDLAVRAALGASMRRLAFGSVVEIGIVAVLAGALGTLAAFGSFRWLALRLADLLPRVATMPFDWRTGAAALIITAIVGVLASVVPAVVGVRISLMETLRQSGRGSGSGAGAERLRRTLIVGQLSIAMVLVTLAGLMARSLSHQLSAVLGFSPSHGFTFELRLPPSRYPEKQGPTFMEHPAGVAFITRVLESIRAIPGVDVAAIGKPLPLSGSQEASVFAAEGVTPSDPSATPVAEYTVASADMFRALGTPLIAGRDFTAADAEDAPAVVIVSQAMAKWLWPNASAIGKRIKLGGLPSGAPWMTVIGVAGDLKRYALTDSVRPEMIVPYTQRPYPTFGTMQFVVRSRRPLADLVREVQRAVTAADPTIPVARVRTIDDLIVQASATARIAAWILTGFGVGATLLAAVGLFGVIGYAVLQRRHEFGVRRALGASPSQLILLVAMEGARLTAVALAVGSVASVLAGYGMGALLYDVTAYDPPTLALTAVVLGLTALLGCVGPAFRAARVEPRVALDEV